MNNHHTFCLRSDCSLNLVNINFKMLKCWLNQDRSQIILCNSKNCCNISISRNYDFVSIIENTQLLISTDNQAQSIQSISYCYTLISTNILSIILLKLLVFITLQEPATFNNTIGCSLILITMLHGDSL